MLERSTLCRDALLLTLHALAIFSNLTRPSFILNHVERIARFWCPIKAKNLSWHGWKRGFHLLTTLIDQGPNLTPLSASNDDITAAQCAALNENSRHWTAAFIKLRFNHNPIGVTLRIGFQLKQFSLQRDRFGQRIETCLLQSRDFNGLNFTAHGFDLDVMLQQVGQNTARISFWQVNFVDRDNDWHFCRFGMADRFNCLRHDRVICRDNQNDNVRHVGTAGPHRREGCVAWCVQEANLVARFQLNLIGANMLRNAASFASNHVC